MADLTPTQKRRLKRGVPMLNGDDFGAIISSLRTQLDELRERLLGAPVISQGAEAANAIKVSVQLYNVAGDAIATKRVVKYWLSDTAAAAPSGTAPTGGTAVATGAPLKEFTAEVFGEAVTDATGLLEVNVTDTGTPTFYFNVQVQEGEVVSEAVTFA